MSENGAKLAPRWGRLGRGKSSWRVQEAKKSMKSKVQEQLENKKEKSSEKSHAEHAGSRKVTRYGGGGLQITKP